MTVSYIGAQGAATTTVTIPAHQVGDLILIFAYRDGSNTVPTAPTAGGTVPTWTQIGSSGGNTNSSRIHYAIATATTTTSGTWTNATELICHVYRGATVGASIGGSGSATTTVNYPALTLQRTDNTSWVAGFAGHRTATNVDLAPGTMVNRAFAGTEAAGHDSNGTRTTWASTNVTVNASSAFRSWVVELRDKTVVLTADLGTRSIVGSAAGFAKGRKLTADKGTFSVVGVDAGIIHQAKLTADKGTITVAGVPASPVVGRRLTAAPGGFSIVGVAATITKVVSRILPADKGTFTGVYRAANLLLTRRLVASPRLFSVAGVPANLLKGSRLTAAPRSFNINLIPASILYSGGQTTGDKPFYYQVQETDPRKLIVNASASNGQLVYYVNNYLRVL